jgi:hypothetical protein
MSTAVRSWMFALSLLFVGSCASTTAFDQSAQTLVESLAGKNDNVVRLTIHAIPDGGTEYMAIASTLASKLGQPSDPEDLQAIESGELVVLDEPGGIDVTVPIQSKDGRFTAATGVTMDAAMGRDAAIKVAKEIAAQIDRDLAAPR